MKLLAVPIVALIALAGCLPNVSTELSEREARALLQREVLTICSARSQTVVANVLRSVENGKATPTRSYWVFDIELPGPSSDFEALVFPSKIVAGDFIVELMTRTCR